ncbi:MAG: dihydroorotate dehydrogenase [Muribaculaceae bacterium]|nr:dihydroorotate dehydrogenase [Muribaculaceae bacterium]
MKNGEIDLSVDLGSLKLDNPIIPASGCFGFGYGMEDYYDVNILGSISLKGTTLEPRFGNPLPRVAECEAGLINSVGLQNPGIHKVIEEELPKAAKVFKKPLIANISGFSIEEYVECCRLIDTQECIGLIELNVSCPNVHGGGMSFGTSREDVAKVIKEVKRVITKPLYVKLTPNVTDIVSIGLAAQEAGADGLVAINTMLGMRIDLKTRRPVIANIMGGFSGPAIFPVALRMVYQLSHACSIPVIGCGGISSAKDVLEMMIGGASAVEIGAANLINPYACKEIIENLPVEMEKLGITNLKELKI